MSYSVQCQMVGDSGYPPWTYSYMVNHESFLSWTVFQSRIYSTSNLFGISQENKLAQYTFINLIEKKKRVN